MYVSTKKAASAGVSPFTGRRISGISKVQYFQVRQIAIS
jgi:hypothetical protein